jgi:NADPH2:quinone reductase
MGIKCAFLRASTISIISVTHNKEMHMRAIGYQETGSIERADALVDIDLPKPEAKGRDILVAIKAVSVNPVDTKVRVRSKPEAGAWRVLGWDAAGVVTAVGSDATLFKPGDDVFYAGAIGRQGTNAEFHLVDERIVGRKPKSVGWAEAAALPLTSLTAWESLFDRLDVKKPVLGVKPAILIVGGAGGVGSIAIQLARRLTDLTVIATASRPDTQHWVTELGAHYVVDHRKPLAVEVAKLGIGAPGFVFSTTQTASHVAEIVELIAPQGRFGLIDDPATLNVVPFKTKSVSVHWELMFTRSTFQTTDMNAQGTILSEVARLVDDGTLKTTLTQRFGAINAANLKRAHALLESGSAKGKIVLEGFGEQAP